MNRYQSNIAEMASTVSTYLATNKTIWQDNAAIVDTMVDVDADLATIGGVDVKQKVTVTGPGADKAAARVNFEEEILVVANQIAAFAAKNKDATLEAQADLSLTKLDTMAADDLVATGTRIGNLATTNLTVLADYSITQADLTKLSGLSVTFDNVKTAPRTAVVNRKKETEMLPPVFQSLFTTLRRRLDRQMTVFKASNPEFYAGYLAARVIVDRGHPAKTKTATAATTKPTP